MAGYAFRLKGVIKTAVMPQPPQAVKTEKICPGFVRAGADFFASGCASLDGLFRLCRVVIKQARKRDLLTQLLHDGGAER